MGHEPGRVCARCGLTCVLRRALAFLLSSGDRDQLNQFRHGRGHALFIRFPARDGDTAHAESLCELRLSLAEDLSSDPDHLGGAHVTWAWHDLLVSFRYFVFKRWSTIFPRTPP